MTTTPTQRRPEMAPDVMAQRIVALDQKVKLLEDRVHRMDWTSWIVALVSGALGGGAVGLF